MTAIVPRDSPVLGPATQRYIGEPGSAALFQQDVDWIAHMLGHQMSTVANVVFGSTEAATGVWRLLFRAPENVRAIVVRIVPLGYTGSTRTISVSGAEGEDPLTVAQNIVDVADLGDLNNPNAFIWVVPVSGTLTEIAITCTNVRMHSLVAYAVPKGDLKGTEEHLDRSYADAGRYITDNVSASDPRGFTKLLDAVISARTAMHRCLVNLPMNAGVTTVGAGPDYLLGSATDSLTVLARDVRGGTSTTIPVRAKVYVGTVGAGTFTVRLALTTGGNIDITGITATGWWPRAGGELVDPGQTGSCAFVDSLVVQGSRTSGAGTVTVNAIFLYEDT